MDNLSISMINERINQPSIQVAVKKDFISSSFISSLRRIGYQGFRFSEAKYTKKELETINKIDDSIEISFHHDSRGTRLCSCNKEMLERAKNSVNKALGIGASYIIFHPGRYRIGKYAQAKRDFINNLLPLLQYCKEREISLVLENNWENLVYDKSGVKITEYRKQEDINIMGHKTEFFNFLLDKIGNDLKIDLDFSHLVLQCKIELIRRKIKNKEFSIGDRNYIAYLTSQELINEVKRCVDNFLEKFHPYIFVVDINETDFYDDVNFLPGDGIGLTKLIVSNLKKWNYTGRYMIEIGSNKSEFKLKYKNLSRFGLYTKSYNFVKNLLSEPPKIETNICY
jgi:sugar phosphate isomerase/epimerase